jgi:large subunit ribosomal protein L6
MSRIGKAPFPFPRGVDVSITGQDRWRSRAPRASSSREIPGPITVRQEDGTLLVERPDDERQNRALHGLFRSLVNNMVVGVTDGFRKELEIVGVGYRATAKGPTPSTWQLGFSTP